MAENKQNQDDAVASSLTSTNEYGRRTWNKEAFAERAASSKNRHGQQDKVVSATAADTKYSSSDFAKNINKVRLVDLSSSTSVHRGKSSGFYCAVCNLTFKDNLSYLNHTNTSYHLQKQQAAAALLGGEPPSKRSDITATQIRQKLKQVYDSKLQRLQKKDDLQYYNLKKRIQNRLEFEENQKELRMQRKRLKSEKSHKEKNKKGKETGADTSEGAVLMQQMGFASFSKSNNK